MVCDAGWGLSINFCTSFLAGSSAFLPVFVCVIQKLVEAATSDEGEKKAAEELERIQEEQRQKLLVRFPELGSPTRGQTCSSPPPPTLTHPAPPRLTPPFRMPARLMRKSLRPRRHRRPRPSRHRCPPKKRRPP
jgi:hypothetical protein